MAEYYPLLVKAVSALDLDANEARQVLYERARKALIGQLRTVMPPLPQAHIDSESRALDLAIARIEAECAVKAALRGGLQGQAGGARPPAPAPRPPQGPQVPPAAPGGLPPRPVITPGTTRPVAPILPPRAPQTAPESPPASAQQAAPVISLIASGHEPESFNDAAPDGFDTPRGAAPPAYPARNGRRDPVRPAAPVKPEPRQRNPRGLIVVVASLLLVFAVAGAAVWRRQSQEDLARLTRPPPPPAATEPGEAAPPPGKNPERAGATGAGTPSPAPNPAPIPAATPAPAAANPPAAADSSLTPVKVPTTTLRPAQPQVAPSAPVATADAGAAGAPASNPASGAPNIPVAHRAAILVDAPDDPQKMKTYPGTVVWRVEEVKREGKSAATVLRAEIEIPTARTQVVMTLQKNVESSLPASHMLELRFTIQPGGDVPGIRAVRVPEMRKEETPAGEPLAGAPVPVVENFFIVGLAKGDVETAHNLDLLSGRNWIDVPMLLTNDKVAKLTFEKGPTGERALNEAMVAWKQ